MNPTLKYATGPMTDMTDVHNWAYLGWQSHSFDCCWKSLEFKRINRQPDR